MRNQRNEEKYNIYRKAYLKTLEQFTDITNIRDKTMYIQKTIFYGVKSIVTKPEPKTITSEEIENNFQFISILKSIIGLLTPGDFMNIFPIEKEFKGHKWGMKDYFHTRDYINSLAAEEPIGEKALEFLWEYTNPDIESFNIHSMLCLSKLRQLEGYPSLAEEWADENGIKMHTMHTGSNGREFLIDKETGKTMRLTKSKPRYLKLVKPGVS